MSKLVTFEKCIPNRRVYFLIYLISKTYFRLSITKTTPRTIKNTSAKNAILNVVHRYCFLLSIIESIIIKINFDFRFSTNNLGVRDPEKKDVFSKCLSVRISVCMCVLFLTSKSVCRYVYNSTKLHMYVLDYGRQVTVKIGDISPEGGL